MGIIESVFIWKIYKAQHSDRESAHPHITRPRSFLEKQTPYTGSTTSKMQFIKSALIVAALFGSAFAAPTEASTEQGKPTNCSSSILMRSISRRSLRWWLQR
jgi:hypothetical protein